MAGIGRITEGVEKMNHKDADASRDVAPSLRTLQSLHNYFTSLTCREPTCRVRLSIDGQARDLIDNWLPRATGYQPARISDILCKRCRKYTCVGCRGKPQLGPSSTTTPIAIVNHCCDKGRLFGIWALLSTYDETELAVQKHAAEKAQTNRSHFPAGKGTGYKSGRESGYFSWQTPIQATSFWKSDEQTDKIITQILQVLIAFVPVSKETSKFDRQPPSEIYALFRLSPLFDRLAGLIRNDSIVDMTKRGGLYHAVLAFLTTVAKHPKLVAILTEQRPEKKRSPGLQQLGGDANQKSFVVDSSCMCPSLVSLGQETYKQAKAYAQLTSNAAILQDLRWGDSQETVAMCREVLGFYQTVKDTVPNAIQTIGPSPKDAWTIFAEENRVTYTDDVLKIHMFHREISQLRNSPPGRMTFLWRELTSLSTSLPAGIFLKVSDTRPDVIKALITGVDGSPYAGGLFIFDVFLPQTWPDTPPLVYFAMNEGLDPRSSVNQSKYQFNPNIHQNGKVCLSLLNTWHGLPEEQWQPRKSTLLSVFVSIQAMILGVSNPIENEPGWNDSLVNPERGFIYNMQVQCKTVLYAMLFWFTSKAKDSVWKEISDKHWKHKGKEVLANLKQWAKSNEYLRAYDKDGPYTFIRMHFSGAKGRTGREVDLVASLEKYLSFEGSVDSREQGLTRYRY